MARRCSNVGEPMLVTLPKGGYEDTGEGGLAFFLIVRGGASRGKRQTCIAGDILWPLQDCQIKPRTWPPFLTEERDYGHHPMEPIDAGLLIGSTGLSLWSGSKEGYFTPALSDLTADGKSLYRTLKRLYGEVTIVTLLDT